MNSCRTGAIPQSAKKVGVLDPPPPGETGTELTGEAADLALSGALADLLKRTKVKVGALDTRVKHGRFEIRVTLLADGVQHDVTLSLSEPWARVLRKRLTESYP